MTEKEIYALISSLSIGTLLIIGGLFLTVGIFYLIVNYKLFEKAGEAGWKSIIPVYSNYTEYCIVGLPGYFIALQFGSIFINSQIISLALYGLSLYVNYRMAKVFKCDESMTLLTIFLPIIGRAIIAFDSTGKYSYDPNASFSINNPGFPNTQNVNPTATKVDPNSNQFIQSGNTSCKFCKNCGTKLYVIKGFCPNCGTKIDED